MLVLSRKCGEKIQIGDDIVVTVAAVSKGRVRIGIDAAPHIHIKRAELQNLEPRQLTSREVVREPELSREVA